MRRLPRILAMSVLTSYMMLFAMIDISKPVVDVVSAADSRFIEVIEVADTTPSPEPVLISAEEVIIKKDNNYVTGWTTTSVNIRKHPNTKSDILETYQFNTKIKYIDHNKKWAKIKYKDGYAYIHKDYISKKKNEYKEYSVPETSGFKSYMSYAAITSKSSPQYKMQHEKAYTGKNGIRQVDGRYCVAIGSYFTDEIGTLFDLVLKNGTVIPCILSDQKADKDTDLQNIVTKHNGCLSEFIVDMDKLKSSIKKMGDVSYFDETWNSPVDLIRVYE